MIKACWWNKRCNVLHLFKSFNTFSNSKILLIWKKFKPLIKNNYVTNEMVKIHWKIYNDLYIPHIIDKNWYISFTSEWLWENKDKQSTFVHWTTTLWLINWYLRSIFWFQDNTEILLTWFDYVRFPAPNPTWWKISSIFTLTWIRNNIILNTNNSTRKWISLTFEAKLFNSLIKKRINEENIRPICKASVNVIFISPSDIT